MPTAPPRVITPPPAPWVPTAPTLPAAPPDRADLSLRAVLAHLAWTAILSTLAVAALSLCAGSAGAGWGWLALGAASGGIVALGGAGVLLRRLWLAVAGWGWAAAARQEQWAAELDGWAAGAALQREAGAAYTLRYLTRRPRSVPAPPTPEPIIDGETFEQRAIRRGAEFALEREKARVPGGQTTEHLAPTPIPPPVDVRYNGTALPQVMTVAYDEVPSCERCLARWAGTEPRLTRDRYEAARAVLAAAGILEPPAKSGGAYRVSATFQAQGGSLPLEGWHDLAMTWLARNRGPLAGPEGE